MFANTDNAACALTVTENTRPSFTAEDMAIAEELLADLVFEDDLGAALRAAEGDVALGEDQYPGLLRTGDAAADLGLSDAQFRRIVGKIGLVPAAVRREYGEAFAVTVHLWSRDQLDQIDASNEAMKLRSRGARRALRLLEGTDTESGSSSKHPQTGRLERRAGEAPASLETRTCITSLELDRGEAPVELEALFPIGAPIQSSDIALALRSHGRVDVSQVTFDRIHGDADTVPFVGLDPEGTIVCAGTVGISVSSSDSMITLGGAISIEVEARDVPLRKTTGEHVEDPAQRRRRALAR